MRGVSVLYRERFGKVLRMRPNLDYHAMLPSIASFYQALQEGGSPPEGVDEGLQVVEYCEATRESASHALARRVGT